jgi:hypothetical protein
MASGCVTGPSFLPRSTQQTFLMQQPQASSARFDIPHTRADNGIENSAINVASRTTSEPAFFIRVLPNVII